MSGFFATCGNAPYVYGILQSAKGDKQTTMQRVKETSNRRAARLDVRLAQRAKDKIEEAALVSHQTVTDFVVTTLLRASDEALRHHQAIRLTNRDRDLFLAALDADERPNAALRKAAQRFKRRSG